MFEAIQPSSLVPLLGVGLGIMLAGVGAVLIRLVRHLRERGVRAPAVVVDTTETPRSGVRGGHVYQPVVRYWTTGGDVVTTPAALGATIAPPRRGRAVTVLYDPDRPATASIASKLWMTDLTSAGFMIAGTVVAAGSVAVIFGAGI